MEARMNRIAYSLEEASQVVPFSTSYLRKATRRTEGNILKAAMRARRITIMHTDLVAWCEKEEDE